MATISHNLIDKLNDDPAKVSIALCTYNGVLYLREQLDSLLAQTHTNFEIIAVDDCSTDETLKILNEYAQRDSRLQAHINPSNQGVKKNFERALNLCTGEYIALCDQDDTWEPEKISALLSVINGHAMAYCDSALMNESGQLTGKKASDLVIMLTTDDPAAFTFDNCVSGHAMLFRHSLLETVLPIPDVFFHDWWIAVCASASGGIIYCELPLVKYRQHAMNITNMARDHINPHRNRPQGYRLNMLRQIEQRISLLTNFPGAHRQCLIRFKALWHARELQYFSFSLAWLMLRHGRCLYATDKRLSFWFLLRRVSHYLLGVKLKRLLNREAYTLRLPADESNDSRSAR